MLEDGCLVFHYAAIALDSRLSEAAGYSDDSPAKPISRKKKSSRKRRHGESTSSRYKIMINHVGMLKELPHKENGNEPLKFPVYPRMVDFAHTIPVVILLTLVVLYLAPSLGCQPLHREEGSGNIAIPALF